ncbi:MAG: cupin domain-containing protein [Candidatus Dormibacteraceae bacterium]
MTKRMSRITIDLHVEGASIAGRVTSDGSGSPFSGWLGLFAVIDRLVADDRPESHPSTRPTFGEPLHRRAGTGRTLDGQNGSCRFLITGPESAGSYTCVETSVPPGQTISTQVHRDAEQTFYVLEGQGTFALGTEVVAASTGDFLNVPRGCPHGFHNDGSIPARLLTTFVPARIEAAPDAGSDPTDSSARDPFVGSEAWLDRELGPADRPPTDPDQGPASTPGGAR